MSGAIPIFPDNGQGNEKEEKSQDSGQIDIIFFFTVETDQGKQDKLSANSAVSCWICSVLLCVKLNMNRNRNIL